MEEQEAWKGVMKVLTGNTILAFIVIQSNIFRETTRNSLNLLSKALFLHEKDATPLYM
jgi:hypothetical protein